MPCKAKNKLANNDPMVFKPSSDTECFLAAMNQNRRLASQFTSKELTTLAPTTWEQVFIDLLNMKFTKVDEATPTIPTDTARSDKAADAQIDEDDIYDIIDAFKIVGPWCEKYTPIIARNDAYNELKRLVGLVANLFDLIPNPHQCPAPPPTPPPCSRPHRDNEDVTMELPATKRVFSEAASQTPAPSHEATMPPPPPAAAATSLAAVASIPPAGPRGRASYAGAAAKNLNPAAPPFVRGPPRAPAAQPPAQAQQPVSSKRSKRPFFATRGPSRRQFYIKMPNTPSDTSLPSLVITANRALTRAKSTLKVDSAQLSPRGITCVTATVPSTSDLDIIEATLSGGLLGARITIPASRSFIKIVDIPYFKSGTTDPFTSAEVDAQLQRSIIPSDFVVHWRYICNSPKADSATVWIDLSDSQ
ncbi:hypothetical protein P691DRAFT_785568 [Macrolepiota fuliginosa MF-IS2]|uniref:Uncharacterized protein n=1 Tax=Macrolepiota fuliginosa MF-IS2 TaxID=1400762 RepID=A0A9P6BUT9_9AGAR|nr:hypothetical protein P691DRAFT_785568 [Macrolepiota fuliginosa MF-IS2]